MGIKICPKCSGKVSTSRNVCIHCGYVFPTTKKCPDCGENLNLDVLECPGCGYLFEKDKNIDLPPNNENESIVCTEINDFIDEKSIKDEENSTEDKNYIVENEEADNSNNELSEINEENDIVENNLISVNNSEDCVEELNANDSSLTIECPYCESKLLISIGSDYYMCETCKGKFLYVYKNNLPINKNVEQKKYLLKIVKKNK